MRALRFPPWLPVLLLAALLTASCGSSGGMADDSPTTSASVTAESSVEPAPELAGIDGWHNSEPLTLEGLRGSPILLVFFRDT